MHRAKTPLLWLALCGAMLHHAPQASAQAWIRPAGSAYANLKLRSIVADQTYDASGDAVPLANDFRQHTVGAYVEAGVVDRWLMLSAEGELFRRSVSVDQGSTSGVGDLRASVWSGLLDGRVRLSLGASLGIPTGSRDRNGSPSLPTGDEEWDVAIQTALGTGFAGGARWPFNHYAQLVTGPWLRTRGIRNGWLYRAELGLNRKDGWASPLWVILRINGLQPFGPEEAAFSAGVSGLGDGVRYHSPGLELLWKLPAGLGVSVAAAGAFLAANVPAAPAFALSFSYERP